MKQPKILDNKNFGKVGDEIKDNVKKGSNLSIISAYFTIFAYKELYKELNKVEKVRFLFTEPTFIKKDKEKIRQYYIKVNAEDTLSGTDFEMKLRNKMTQANIAKECATWLKEKVEFKSFKEPNPAQQRLLYVENKNKEDDIVINGSLDFTTEGLGYAPSSRIDMNTCMYGRDCTNQFLSMFDMIWDDSSKVEDVKSKVLEQIQVIYKENTPEFLYFVTLYNIFKDYLDDITEENIVKTKTGFKETTIWNKLYKFQKDGVIGAIDKLEKYNGCIIADSVGLGKTFSALAVIKYYELRNHRVLVLAPKKLRDNWTMYTKNDKRNLLVDDRFNYDVLNHTDLTREKGMSGDIDLRSINWGNYDLVVIDESHNFRNNNTKDDKVTRYSKLLNDIVKAGVKTKMLLLSATPVNNKMNDLKNQIVFITEGKDNSFEYEGISSVEQTLRKAQTIFNKWSDLNDQERTLDSFLEMMNADYFKLLDTITIARSRKHIEKYYGTSEVGKFPTRLKPINKKASIDTLDEFPELEYVNKLIKNLNLGFYSPLKYVLPDKKPAYDKKYNKVVNNGAEFKMTDREDSLVNLMRVNILKRLESSIYSFNKTIEVLLYKIENSLNKISELKNGEYDASLDINEIEIDDSVLEELLIGNKVKVLISDMDVLKWRQDLQEDKDKLVEIYKESKKIIENIQRDTKLNILKDLISDKLNNPINENNKKVMIFSAFSDTTNYLYEHISTWALNEFGIHTGLVNGSGNNKTTATEIKRKELNDILTNFSPISKEKSKVCPEIKSEIDILIATDCISEGQNCQDCDMLINYDIHWNPVKIIQRFGRIDRLGSKNDKIQLVNFWPNLELDEYINLESRVTGRMMLLDVSATGEENIISNDKKGMNDLQYRKKQLKQLQEEVVDLEDISGGISITDLTMNDFKMDLSSYMKENLNLLERAPKGMYSIVENDESLNIENGVIFTLKQVTNAQKKEENNNLYPYYLVYVSETGEIKINHLRAKKVLDLYRRLCKNQNKVLSDLVEIFNSNTKDGSEMNEYTELLEIAVANIVGKKEEKGIASLFSKGGTTAKKKDAKTINDFELVSFLIIK